MEKNFETEVLTRLAVIESKIDDYKKTETLAYNADNRSKKNEADIQEMKENSKWLRRTIIGEIIGLVFLAISIFIKLK